ncbi:MAG: glycosyltransferase family 4 protein [Verrucomicrobiae bacterium]|nr:glycosyltransferase family 4 protein [Verrucomicrobiae bacterium]
MRLGILTSHPIQYQAPWFRALAEKVDLEVFFAHRQSAAEQGRAGFGVAFDWDVDLLSGYRHRFLKNLSPNPGVSHYGGCDTPEIERFIANDTSPNPLPERGGEGASGFHFDAFIVTGWYLKSHMQAVNACRRAGVPVLVRGDSQLGTPRSAFKRLAMEIRQRWLLKRFDGFLSVGKRHTEYLRHYGVPAERIFFAPHFVDNDWFAECATRSRAPLRLNRGEGSGEVSKLTSIAAIRKQWGAGESDLVALFVGKFIPKKRPADLLRSIALVRRGTPCAPGEAFSLPGGAHGVTRPTAVFVGSGELERELREQAARDNLRVHFAGFKNQTELPAVYATADVLVLPSESETWGLVVNEAMACGLPAIVSDAVGCAPDLMEEGVTGFTYPVGDTEQLAERLVAFGRLKLAGHDFESALAARMRAYSVTAAVNGTMKAVEWLTKRNAETLETWNTDN